MRKFQLGDWNAGLEELEELIDKYPYSGELLSLQHEMEIRANIDNYEQSDLQVARRKRIIKWALRAVVLAAFFGVLIFAVRTYSEWMQSQLLAARQAIEAEAEVVQLAVRFRDGQNLLQAGRPDVALEVFQEIAAADPEYAGLQGYIEEAQRSQDLEIKYVEAIRLSRLNDLAGALAIFEEIKAEDPFYKDVALRVDDIQNQFFLGDILAQAQEAFQARDWEQAASSYETVRAIDQEFQPDEIENRLYDSYINAAMAAIEEDSTSFENLERADSFFRKALALRPQDSNIQQERERVREIFRDSLSQKYVQAAQAALNDQADSIQAQEVAEEYFRKALALRPEDPEILLQRDLARRYIQAQEDFSNGLWNEVIASLEQVHAENPDYATGTSRQTLYEAYIARGEYFMSFGEYEEALSDFTRAISLAEESSSPILRQFYAQINAAEAKGALSDFEDADFQYQDAIASLGLEENNVELSADTQRNLDRAENYMGLRYYKLAYQYYRKSAPQILAQYSTVTHVVESGEYLTMLANRYNTTVEAIIKANNLDSPKQIQVGQELIVPGLGQ